MASRTIVGLLVAGSVSWTAARGGEEAADRQQRLRDAWGNAIPGLLARYQLADALDRGGIGRSDGATSGALGWNESEFLRRYLMCYGVTGDPYWLDKVVDHADRAFASLKDHDGDGFLSWQDPGYSVGLVEVVPQGDAGDLTVTLVPPDGRVYVGRGGELITGHAYALDVTAPGRVAVTDATEGRSLSPVATGTEAPVEVAPGVRLKLAGGGTPGARLTLRTRAPQPCEYQVHGGMVLYPLALFVERVLADPALPPPYAAKARQYLDTIHRHFVLRWEKTWVELPPDAGLYRFTDAPTQRFPGYSLPHNQYLAPARVCLVLGQLPGYDGATLCAERARKMAANFRRCLRTTAGDAYVWYYWDPLPHETRVTPHIEDASHGTIDVGFVLEAVRRGVVFSRVDLERLARTYMDVMWDGNREDPRFGRLVDGSRDPASMWWEWIRLAEADPRVWDIATAIFERHRRPLSMVAPMAELYDRIAGLTAEQRRQCREQTAAVLAVLHTEGVLNPGFEIEAPDGGAPLGWTLGVWTPDDGSSTEWTRDAHEGARAVALVGGGRQVNVWAQGDREFAVPTPGGTARIRAWYKAEPGTRPDVSVLGSDAKGGRLQYETSPAFAVSDTWSLAEWSVPLKPEVRAFRVLLRNHAAGRVLWDDVEVTTGP